MVMMKSSKRFRPFHGSGINWKDAVDKDGPIINVI